MSRPTSRPLAPNAARRLLRLADGLERPVLFMGRAASWLILPLIGIIIVDAVCRKFLRKLDVVIDTGLYHLMNSPVFQDAEWHLHAIIFLCAFGYAYAHNAHVRLDIFRPRLTTKARVWIEITGGVVLLLPFLGVLLYYGWDFVVSAWQTDEISAASTGIANRWVVKSFLVTGLMLMAAAAGSVLIRLVVYRLGPPELEPAARVEAFARPTHSAFDG